MKELFEVILNSVNIFRESQQSIKVLIDKLIYISIEENKKYIDNKEIIFFGAMEKINMSGNKQKEIEIIKEKEERKKRDKKEIIVNWKNIALKEKNNSTLEINKNLICILTNQKTKMKFQKQKEKINIKRHNIK